MGLFRGLDEGGKPITQYFAPAEEAHAQAQGFTPLSTEEAGQVTGAIDDRTGGALGAVGAAATSALSGTTLGLSDVGLRAILSPSELARVRADREAHPVVSGAAGFLGALAPAVLSGGAAMPSALAGRAGAAITEGLGGGLKAAVVGGAAEGALFGAGSGVSELALSDDPLDMEHAASALSSNMLYGAAFGGALGGLGKAAEIGLTKAKDVIDAKLGTKALSDASVEQSPDLATLDKKGLAAEHDKELGAIAASQEPERQEFVDAVNSHVQATDDERLWQSLDKADKYDRELGKVSRQADLNVKKLTDNRIGLAERPQRALNALQTQGQALGKIEASINNQIVDLSDRWSEAPGQIKTEILAGNIPGEKGPFTASGLDMAIDRELRRRFPVNDAGELSFPKLERAQQAVSAARVRNADLQARIAKLGADPTSERLSQIEAAQELLGEPKKKTLGEHLLHLVPGGSVLGEVAEIGSKVSGGLRAAIGKGSEKVGAAASVFLDKASKVVAKAPLATKVLGSISYAPAGQAEALRMAPRAPATGLADLYHQRTDEVKSQVQIAADGTFQMRPEARAAMAAKLRPIAAVNPIAADRIETLAARRIQFLAAIIPRRPDLAGAAIGPDHWQPSDIAMRSWARSAAAVEDPQAVFDRVIAGIVTPEDTIAMRTVYPEMLSDFVQRTSSQLPQLRHTLPYDRRLSLSMFSGVPVDPSLDPKVLSVLQGQFAAEPGTAGGTQAPVASPQFGSIKKSPDLPTPAQSRAQGGVHA